MFFGPHIERFVKALDGCEIERDYERPKYLEEILRNPRAANLLERSIDDICAQRNVTDGSLDIAPRYRSEIINATDESSPAIGRSNRRRNET